MQKNSKNTNSKGTSAKKVTSSAKKPASKSTNASNKPNNKQANKPSNKPKAKPNQNVKNTSKQKQKSVDGKEAFALICMLLGVFVVFSIIGNDDSFLGKHVETNLYKFFGLGIYILPVMLFSPIILVFAKRKDKINLSLLMWELIAFLSIDGLVFLAKDLRTTSKEFSGTVGFLVGDNISGLFGVGFSYVLLVTLVIVSIAMIFEVHLVSSITEMFNNTKEKVNESKRQYDEYYNNNDRKPKKNKPQIQEYTEYDFGDQLKHLPTEDEIRKIAKEEVEKSLKYTASRSEMAEQYNKRESERNQNLRKSRLTLPKFSPIQTFTRKNQPFDNKASVDFEEDVFAKSNPTLKEELKIFTNVYMTINEENESFASESENDITEEQKVLLEKQEKVKEAYEDVKVLMYEYINNLEYYNRLQAGVKQPEDLTNEEIDEILSSNSVEQLKKDKYNEHYINKAKEEKEQQYEKFNIPLRTEEIKTEVPKPVEIKADEPKLEEPRLEQPKPEEISLNVPNEVNEQLDVEEQGVEQHTEESIEEVFTPTSDAFNTDKTNVSYEGALHTVRSTPEVLHFDEEELKKASLANDKEVHDITSGSYEYDEDYTNNIDEIEKEADSIIEAFQNTYKNVDLKAVVNSENPYDDSLLNAIENVSDEIVEDVEIYEEVPTYEDNVVSVQEVVSSPIVESVVETIELHSQSNTENKNDGQQIERASKIVDKPYSLPKFDFLVKNTSVLQKNDFEYIEEKSKKLEQTLKSFGVDAKVVEVSRGPSVTRFEVQPGVGVKVSKIANLSDDLALNLEAKGIRIQAPIPGKRAVGIEVPNDHVEMVYLRDILESENFKNFDSKLAFGIGKDIAGEVVVHDVGKMPHLLVAGATGSGKSVCINTLITSLLYKSTPDDVKLIMIDPKVVELSIYNGIPHLMIPVVTDPRKASSALQWAVAEMEKRFANFAGSNVRDLNGYNKWLESRGFDKLPRVVIIIDELADLMMTSGKEVEDSICRLAQKARAAGIHLIVATQRPSVDVITGLIKANIPSRLAFAVSSGTDSRTILDQVGAEKLLGKGDMLFYPMGSNEPLRIQGAFISDQEVENVVNYLKSFNVENPNDDLIKEMTEQKKPDVTEDELQDELMYEAMDFFIERDKASASMLQTRFRIGFNRAARLVEILETLNYISPQDGSKPRKILITQSEWEEIKNS